MIIPEHLQHYIDPTLVLVGDFEHVIIYRAQGDTIEELITMESPEPKQTDSECPVSQIDLDRGIRREKFSKDLVAELARLLRSEETLKVQIVLPAEMCRRITEDMPNDVANRIHKILKEDLAQEKLIDVLEKLRAE